MSAADIALLMPMAGRGSQFRGPGHDLPKPLIPLYGRPFFEWAVESVRRVLMVREAVFVVLREHVEAYRIDAEIMARYPKAKIVALETTTSGPAETASFGLAAVSDDVPIAINDCDHAFDGEGLGTLVDAMRDGAAGALVGFRSTNPAYSYVRFDAAGGVAGTIEKQVASQSAIAGCYFLDRRATFLSAYEAYRAHCPYPELFVSGLYNELIAEGRRVVYRELRRHAPFGTPEDVARLKPEDFAFFEGRALT